jgi:uncharacterized cupin superfamily protein
MPDLKTPLAIDAMQVAPRSVQSIYPAPFAALMAGREKRALGERFGLKTIGVNLTGLTAGAQSALHHWHTVQEEFIYILSGAPMLISDNTKVQLQPGMCAGFGAGGAAHHLVNQSDQEVVYLEFGTRAVDDSVTYPADDLHAQSVGAGKWVFTRKDGTPY